jgi:tetratricopeptide (TPR) repeat protein
VLNRLNVPVRAGLISRVHGVPFSEFREKFFGPLEHVVQARRDEITGDYSYFARHPEIAQIVFEQVLQDPRDRYHEYVRVLQELNLAYSSDQTAFRQMIRARSLHDLFPSHEDVVALYSVAQQMASDDAYVLQQIANYERLRPNGNLIHARELLERARQLNPRDSTLLHSLAEVIRSQAVSADSQLMRERLRKEARVALAPLLRNSEESSYANHTMIKLAFDDLRERLAEPSGSERDVDAALREAERILLDAMQRHPDEEMFLAAEADLSSMLNDNERALKALERALSKNPRDPFIASRLATIYQARGEAPNSPW